VKNRRQVLAEVAALLDVPSHILEAAWSSLRKEKKELDSGAMKQERIFKTSHFSSDFLSRQ